MSRFAIYFAPAVDSPLLQFGSACLGRDAATGAELTRPPVDGLAPDRWRAITASPRMYGFHATLKPPFHLAEGCTRDQLLQRLERFAARRRTFQTSPLRVARIADFLALVLSDSSAPLLALAEASVRDFDGFRAPASAGDLARRRSASLTPRQRELLEAWGYPYVLDEWRFHMTLASGLSPAEIASVLPALERAAAPHCAAPLVVDAVCLFEQPAADAPFLLSARFPFTGGAR